MWNSTGLYVNDKNAIIFSLVNKEKRPLLFENSSNDINYNYCPTFGRGNDIFISNNSNMNENSCSNIGLKFYIYYTKESNSTV